MIEGTSRRGWLRGLMAGLAGLVALRQARGAGNAGAGPAPFPGGVAPGTGGLLVTTRHDAAGRLVFASYEALPAEDITTYSYDAGSAPSATYSYDGSSRLTSVTDPPGAVTTHTYFYYPPDSGA